MAEVQDVTGDIELNADSDGSFGDWAGGMVENTPGLKTVSSGVDTVTNIWKGLPEDPDAVDIAMHAGNVASDAAGFVAECATEAASAVLDPVGWLVENGLDMVLHLVTPLQDLLHQVTGDGPRLGEAAEDFTSIGDGLVSYSEEFVRVTDEALQGWQGDASQAARRSLATFAQGIQGVATSAGGVSRVLKISSMIMQVVEAVIKAIITELVSWLIWIWLPALATSIASFGASVAAAMSASVAKAAATFSRVTAKMGKLGKLLDQILEFFRKFGSNMVKLGKKLGVEETGGFANQLASKGDDILRKVADPAIGKAGVLKEAVTESLKSGGNAASQEVIGIDVTNPDAGNGIQVGKTINDVTGKVIDHGTDVKSVTDGGELGSGASAEETEDQLKM